MLSQSPAIYMYMTVIFVGFEEVRDVMKNSDYFCCCGPCRPECKLVFEQEIHKGLSEGKVDVWR